MVVKDKEFILKDLAKQLPDGYYDYIYDDDRGEWILRVVE